MTSRSPLSLLQALLLSAAVALLQVPTEASAQSTLLDVQVFAASPDPVSPGGRQAHQVRVANNGISPTDAVLTVTYDPNVSFVQASMPPDPGTTNRWTFPDYDSTTYLTIEVEVGAGVADGTVLTFEANLSDPLGGVDTDSRTSLVDDTIQSTLLDVHLFGATPNPVSPGGRQTHLVRVANEGIAPLDAVLTLTYDANVSFVQASPPPDAGTTNQWTFPNHSSFTYITVEVEVGAAVPDGTILTLTGSVSDPLGGVGTHSRTSAVDATIQSTLLNVRLQAASPDPVSPGARQTHQVRVGNDGLAPLDGVLTVTYDPNVSFVQASTPPDAGTTNRWTFPDHDSTTYLTIEVEVDAGVADGTVLTLEANLSDPLGGVDTDTRTSLVDDTIQSTLLDVHLFAGSPDPVSPGGGQTHLVRVANDGLAPLDAVLTMTYDPNVSFVQASPPPDAGTTDQWTFPNHTSFTYITVEVEVGTAVPDGTILTLTGSVSDPLGGVGTHSRTTSVSGCFGAVDGTPCNDGDACTTGDACQAGTCVSGTTPTVCDDGSACTTDTCESPAGCVFSPIPDGTACDDGVSCTTGDMCQGGTCTGTPLCDDGNPCTNDLCAPGEPGADASGCLHEEVPDATPCQDGSFCTVGDTCQAGVCASGTPRVCGGDACSPGFCDEGADECVVNPLPDGASCDDGLSCTANDSCQGGVCGGESLCGDGNSCTQDVCDPFDPAADPSGCVNATVSDGFPCDDGSFCTDGDVCQSGVCQSGAPRDCSGPCLTGICDEAGDRCVTVADDTPCDDGISCTVDDTCRFGTCVARSLCIDGNECTNDLCAPGDPSADGNGCINPPVIDGSECSDGLFCTVDDTCQAGLCTGGGLRDCASDCTRPICLEEFDRCASEPDGLECEDGSICTTNETCAGGVCVSEDRCDDDNSCTSDLCVPGDPGADANGCVFQDLADGVACDDGAFCTAGDVCAGGSCAGVDPPDCSGPCVTGICDEGQSGCVPEPDGLACDDGLPETVGDQCLSGTCWGAPRCDDDDPCTTDVYDPSDPIADAEGCVHTVVADGTSCEDGSFCTVGDVCQAGVCEAGTARDCTGTCTTGVCDETSNRCEPVANGLACDDGLICTDSDSCQAGQCVGASLCDDGIACTLDRCRPGDPLADANGCVFRDRPDGALCDDGQFCMVGETCQAGVCSGGTPLDCGGPCLSGVCDEAGQRCEPAVDGTACDDGQLCTTGDVCAGGVCGGQSACTDGDLCTVDLCDPGNPGADGSGCVFAPVADGISCDDGLFCTVGETCQSGVCSGGGARDCSGECQTGFCDESGASCELVPAGTSCDDGIACTNGDACSALGVCGGQSACSDGEACTIDACDPGAPGADAIGCVFAPVGDGNECDDGLYCTVGETCQAGACTGSAPRDCTGECRTGVCDEAGQTCELVAAGTACDDGIACTSDDVCSGDTCGGQNACSDDEACTTDTCEPGAPGADALGCVFSPVANGGQCDDGLYCTTGETCQAGTCAGGVARDCSGQCLTGVCDDEVDECEVVPFGTACDDGKLCTANDVCSGTSCAGTDSCPEGGDCTDEKCIPGAPGADPQGCVLVPVGDGGSCEDDLYCTVDTTCQGGVCGGGTARDCTGQCLTGSCDEIGDACVPVTVGTACDDGKVCTDNEACTSGGFCHGTCSDKGCCSGSCEILPAATECRPIVNACDLAESCSGVDLFCPIDDPGPPSCTGFDLVADWSDDRNPNTPWGLWYDGALLEERADTNLADFPGGQPGWGVSPLSDVFWFKSVELPTDVPGGVDWQIGDVVAYASAAGEPVTSVTWTSSFVGSIDVMGSVWPTREGTRTVNWRLLLNGLELTAGQVFDGDPYSRLNPFLFSDGSAGPGILQALNVAEGDTLELELQSAAGDGDFVGVDLSLSGDLCEGNPACEVASDDIVEETGGVVTTDHEEDGATSGDPVETTVTTKGPGEVLIREFPLPPGFELEGYTIFDTQIEVEAPSTTDVDDPMVISFVFDRTALPPGLSPATLRVFKDGTGEENRVPVCTAPAPRAEPAPSCFQPIRLQNKDFRIDVRTLTASVWLAGVEVPDGQLVYKISASKTDTSKLPKDWNVTLNDVWLDDGDADDPENYGVKKALSLLNPAQIDDDSTLRDAGLHYVRYRIARAREGAGDPDEDGRFPKAEKHRKRRWELENDLGRIVVASDRVSALMVPAATALAGDAQAPVEDETHYRCYAVKPSGEVSEQTPAGSSGKGVFLKDVQTFAFDHFDDCLLDRDGADSFPGTDVAGKCLFDLKSPVELCNPAEKTAVEGERETSAVVADSEPQTAASLLCYPAKKATKIKSAAAAAFAQQPVGTKLRQAKHVKRLAKLESEVSVAPGNLFPSPQKVDTKDVKQLCIPTRVLSESML